jgi:hypothetical protein
MVFLILPVLAAILFGVIRNTRLTRRPSRRRKAVRMNFCVRIYMRNILTIIMLLPCIVFAGVEANSDIESVIKEHLYERESFEVKHIVQGAVVGHKAELKVVQWTLMGASYWRNYITVLDYKKDNIEIDTKQVYGQVESIFIENSLIIVKAKEKGQNDANCCPSVEVTRSYKLVKQSIVEVHNPSN